MMRPHGTNHGAAAQSSPAIAAMTVAARATRDVRGTVAATAHAPMSRSISAAKNVGQAAEPSR